MNIEPITSVDLPSLKPFQPPEWSNISPSLEYYTQHIFCHPIKILQDDKIIGIGNTILFEDTAWLSHIITHPDHRGKGIGSYITKTLVERIPNHFQTIYLIATAMGEPVYAKQGFTIENEYAFMKSEELYPDTSSSSIHVIKFPISYKEPLLQLDLTISGENRIHILEAHLDDALLYISDGKILGYYLPTLGDGFIAALEPEAGIELMKIRMQTKKLLFFPL